MFRCSRFRLLSALVFVLLPVLRPVPAHAQVADCVVPPPGTQTSDSLATLTFMTGASAEELSLTGKGTVIAHTDRGDVIETEIIAMSLQGHSTQLGEVMIRESSSRPSSGQATNLQCLPGPDGMPTYFVDSFFDVFVDITVETQPGQVFRNDQPIRMQSREPVPLDHRKPGVVLVQVGPPVPIVVGPPGQGQVVGQIRDTRHELVPPPPPPTPCYPPAGKDVIDSNLLHDIDIPGIGLCEANLSGPVVINRSDPYRDPATGLLCIDTEMVDMLLQGVDPVCGRICITLSPFQRSLGQICEKVAGTCFPANSWFMIFIKVELKDLGMCFYSCKPAKMHCMIDAIPPIGCFYNLDLSTNDGKPLELHSGPCNPAAGFDPCTGAVGAIIHKAVHEVRPPTQCKCFPRKGEDTLDTSLFHQIVLPGLDLTCTNFTGPMVVRRSDPYLNNNGLCCLDTEIIRMEMHGTCSNGLPAVIRLCPNKRSVGTICQMPGMTTCFPAQSCFEIFFEVEVTMADGTPMKFKNCKPAIMCCKIDDIPPLGCPYALQNGPVELYKVPASGGSPCLQSPLPNPDGFVQEATHRPIDPLPPCCPEYGPGMDTFDSKLVHGLVIPGIGQCAADLSGPVKIIRGTPYIDPATGLCCVEVEMVSLDLRGDDPDWGRICITLDPRQKSRGRICQKQRGACFPALSCFDVFVRIELKDRNLTFISCDPAKMCCMIDAIPPIGCPYGLELAGLALYREPSATTIGGGGGVPANCTVADDGTGTARLPPAGCDYLSPDQVHMIVDGLPAGTTIELAPIHKDFICNREQGCSPALPVDCSGTPGGNLGGEKEVFCSTLELQMQGTGDLATFSRMVSMSPTCETHIAPRMRGDPVQSFPTDMFMMQGQLPAGDPDFDLLRITGGTGFGLPSPGHTTLTQIPGNQWAVDSFFDITYRIDFVGAPGGRLAGRSGSTTGTIRMQTGGGGGGTPTNPCDQDPRPNPDAVVENARHTPVEPCTCYPPEGFDTMESELAHRIRLPGLGAAGDIVCDADMRGPVVVKRSKPYIDPVTGLCCIDTEMVRMELRGEDPNCGTVIVRLCPNKPSTGRICEKQPGTCFPANSFFDLFVEIHIPKFGLVLKNCAPARVECMIDAIPPINCVYELNLSDVLLYRQGECEALPNPNIRPTGFIEKVRHVPRMLCDCPEYGPRIDDMQSQLNHEIVIFGMPGTQQKLCDAHLSGPVVVETGKPYKTTDAAGNVLCCVSSRITDLQLAGTDPVCGPVRIRLCPDMPSRGTICQMMPGACFPAQSCFDVFIEIEVMGMVLKNCKPARMCCKVDSLPPFGCVYLLDPGPDPLLLFKKGDCGVAGAQPVGEIRRAEHIPEPKPCAIKIDCTQTATGDITISWNSVPAGCCTRVALTKDGAVIQTFPGGPGSFTLPCEPGRYCVECRDANGQVLSSDCCTIDACPCPVDDPIAAVTCDTTTTGEVVISWSLVAGVDADDCCDAYQISKDGVPIATAAGGSTSFTLPAPCMPGDYCVQCIKPDGTLGPRHCCVVQPGQCPCPPDADAIASVKCTSALAANQVVIEWTLTSALDARCCQRVLITKDGAAIATVPSGQGSHAVPCMPGKYCVQCVHPDGSLGPEHCCTVTDADCVSPCPEPCDEKCRAAGCCEPTGCNGVRVCTVLPPDQFQFDVFINLQSFCGTVLIKECQASFSLMGDPANPANPGGEFWTLQDKCRALVRAIRNDPDCQAAGYCVVDDDCNGNPPCFTLIDATCPGARVVMGISNDPDIFDQEIHGALPDYEAETITALCDPTPNDPSSGDEPAAVVGFAGVATGRKIVEEMQTSTAGVMVHHMPGAAMRAEVMTMAGMPAAEIAMMLAVQLRAMGVMVRQNGGHLLFPPMMGMGGGGGILPPGGVAGFTNDDGLHVGNFGGPEENLPPPPPGGGGLQKPFDCNQDTRLDISDVICLLGFLFQGSPTALPCGDGASRHPANLTLMSANGDPGIDISDVIYGLGYLFLGGPPPVSCVDPRCLNCIPIQDCPAVCTQ